MLPISHGLLLSQDPMAVVEMVMDPVQVSGGVLSPIPIITLKAGILGGGISCSNPGEC